MDFREIDSELNELCKNTFTMDTFRYAGKLKKAIEDNYIYEFINKKSNARDNFEYLMTKFNDIMFQILKVNLQFEDETIKKIMNFLIYRDYLEDIYILDGNVIGKVLNFDDGKQKTISYLSHEDARYEIESFAFNNTINDNNLRALIVRCLNGVLNPKLVRELNGEDAILIENNNIVYNNPYLKVYFNRSLLDLITNGGVAKILVKYGNEELYYYDLKIRDGYVSLSDTEYQIKKVSSLLDSKKMVKKR